MYDTQRRTEKLKRGWGETEGGRILIKNYSFCEIFNKMSQKGGGVRTVVPPSVGLWTRLTQSQIFGDPDIWTPSNLNLKSVSDSYCPYFTCLCPLHTNIYIIDLLERLMREKKNYFKRPCEARTCSRLDGTIFCKWGWGRDNIMRKWKRLLGAVKLPHLKQLFWLTMYFVNHCIKSKVVYAHAQFNEKNKNKNETMRCLLKYEWSIWLKWSPRTRANKRK